MADKPRTPNSPTLDLHSLFGFSKNATLKDIGKAYKSLITRRNNDKTCQMDKSPKGRNKKNREERNRKNREEITSHPSSPLVFESRQPNSFENMLSSAKFLSRTLSRRSKTPTPSSQYLSRSPSRRCTTPTPVRGRERQTSTFETEMASASPPRNISRSISASPAASLRKNMSRKYTSENEITDSAGYPMNRWSSPETEVPGASLSRNISRRATTPIIFSQSTVKRAPPPIEKKLECTLEELCFGCVKKIKVTRDVIRHPGVVLQEEEILTLEVKRGWIKGTKITFEGKGDEKPGYLPADIVILIDEKTHPLFERDGDNLEIAIEIPLVNALTGCSIPVPLLGGEKMILSFEDTVIYPGYKKVIRGQGMPNPKQDNWRGDLHIKFLVNFPTELSNEQREEAASFLQDCY